MGCIWEVHDSVNMQALLDLEATHTQGYDAVHNHVILFLHCISAYISLFPGCSGRLRSCVAPLGIYPGNKKLLLSVPSRPHFFYYLLGGRDRGQKRAFRSHFSPSSFGGTISLLQIGTFTSHFLCAFRRSGSDCQAY